MFHWRDEKIGELAPQLAYSPAGKRADQIAGAVDLLSGVEPGKSYPWEFVLFRITGYRPTKPVEHAVDGAALRHDLGQLIEDLSATLELQAANYGDGLLTLEQLAAQWEVSVKTITRWRRQGLPARWFLWSDGRRRIGFLKEEAQRFGAANGARLQSAAQFRQLGDTEKKWIIRAAWRLARRHGWRVKTIAQRLGERLGCCQETIRYTIRNHDWENPQTAVFPEKNTGITAEQRRLIMGHFERGLSADELAKYYRMTPAAIRRVITRQRAQQIKNLTIEFIPNGLFEIPEADHVILNELPAAAFAAAKATVAAGQNAKAKDLLVARVPRDLPSPLSAMFNQPVMPQEMETDAFRRMNYLKFKAARLQSELAPEQATEAQVAAITGLLDQANELKNLIVQSNLRIGVHVARRHTIPGIGGARIGRLTLAFRAGGWSVDTLMELVSDASIWLMRSAEKFDFSRGVKFSTYAQYAIMKNFARERSERISAAPRRMVTGQDEMLGQVGSRDARDVADQADMLTQTGELEKVIVKLPPRERDVLAARYGLEESRPAMSLSEVGAQLGITKSRVRQIEVRAIKRLRRMMEEERGSLEFQKLEV